MGEILKRFIFSKNKDVRMEQSVINMLNDFFTLQPVEKAWVFGSYSRGEETDKSDIDILVRFDDNARMTLLKYADIIISLKKILHREVDLVEEGQLKSFANDQVEHDKILIYERKTKR